MAELHAARKLHIGGEAFSELARGGSDPESLEILWRLHASRITLFLLKIFADRPDLAGVLATIEAARTANPDGIAELLAYPWVGVWARRAAADTRVLDTEYARGLAIAAVLRAGLSATVAISPVAGKIAVPTIGMMAKVGTGVRTVDPAQLSGPGWMPLRTIASAAGGLAVRLRVDDLDPYRDCHGYEVASRLDEETVDRLQTTLDGAWNLLVAYAPTRAAELALGLTSLVPLTSGGANQVSASHQEAYGGYAMSLHADPAGFAATMIHEFQHSKLNALHGLVPLYHPDARGRYFAPWRPDARPIGGLLHGIYAFLSMAAWWNAVTADEVLHQRASRHFSALRIQVWRALDEADRADGLTFAGRLFVAKVRESAAQLMEVTVEAGHDAPALADLQRLESAWRRRHNRRS